MFSQEKFIVFQIVVPPLAVPSFSLATFRSTVLLFSSFANKESVCGYLWVESESKSVSYSVMSDSVTPWTVGHQAPLSVEFSRQEYWGGLPFPSPYISNNMPKKKYKTKFQQSVPSVIYTLGGIYSEDRKKK